MTFRLKPLGQSSSLYVELSLKGGFSICTNGHGHGPLIKIAAIFIYGKTLKNLLLRNEESYEVKSLYIASGTHGLSSLFK